MQVAAQKFSPSGAKRVLLNGVLGIWLLLASGAAATLTAWHWASLPVHTNSLPVSTTWQVRHYLARNCACSRAVASYLARRGPDVRVKETVVLIGSEKSGAGTAFEQQLQKRGFALETLEADIAASGDRVEGVPMLEVIAPNTHLGYRGGYRQRGARSGTYSDLEIISALMASRAIPALPVYGCATSLRRQQQFDPLGLKRL